MSHWAEAYIGKPWVLGGQGPDAYDCGGLVRAIARERFGLEIPEVTLASDAPREYIRAIRVFVESDEWRHITEPAEGDGVTLSHSRHPHHVGVWVDVDHGGVLHALEGIGVVFTDMTALRRNGWSRIEFYRHHASVDRLPA